MKRTWIGSFAVAALSAVSAANAALITSSPGGTVVNFSQFAACTNFFVVQPACQVPENVGGLVGEAINFTGTSTATPGAQEARLYNASWGLNANGNWTGARNGYAGLNNQTTDPGTFMMFTFLTPVSAIAGFMNYAVTGVAGQTPIIEALDAGNNVLESYNLSLAPISTTGEDNGAFRGIARASNDIFSFRIRGGLVPVLDDLTFTRSAAVPEPGSLALLGAGLAALGALRFRRRSAD